MEKQAAEIATITVEAVIETSPEHVWKALTAQIGGWWPADFYTGGEEGKRSFFLEAQPGGRMYEQWDNGGGVLWGTVYCVDPNVRLQVLGALFPNWGGPSEWYGTWDLSPKGKSTKLTFRETTLGKIPEAGLGDKSQGWHFLCDTMKAFVEGTSAPVWEG